MVSIKKNLFEQALIKLDREEVSLEIYESVQAAYQQVITGYNKTLKEKQAALAFQSQPTPSILSNGMQKVKSWITSPLKKNQKQSFDLIEIKIGNSP